MADGAGLYLLVTPAGGKLWRLKFRIDGRERKLSIGSAIPKSAWPMPAVAAMKRAN
jgi:hypothetical protein